MRLAILDQQRKRHPVQQDVCSVIQKTAATGDTYFVIESSAGKSTVLRGCAVELIPAGGALSDPTVWHSFLEDYKTVCLSSPPNLLDTAITYELAEHWGYLPAPHRGSEYACSTLIDWLITSSELEEQRIEQAIQQFNSRFKLYVLLILHSRLRPSDIRVLTWDQLVGDHISLPSGKLAVLSAVCVEALLGLNRKTGYVFKGVSGKPVVSYRRQMLQLLKMADVNSLGRIILRKRFVEKLMATGKNSWPYTEL